MSDLTPKLPSRINGIMDPRVREDDESPVRGNGYHPIFCCINAVNFCALASWCFTRGCLSKPV